MGKKKKWPAFNRSENAPPRADQKRKRKEKEVGDAESRAWRSGRGARRKRHPSSEAARSASRGGGSGRLAMECFANRSRQMAGAFISISPAAMCIRARQRRRDGVPPPPPPPTVVARPAVIPNVIYGSFSSSLPSPFPRPRLSHSSRRPHLRFVDVPLLPLSEFWVVLPAAVRLFQLFFFFFSFDECLWGLVRFVAMWLWLGLD